jgi:hypothetical protein
MSDFTSAAAQATTDAEFLSEADAVINARVVSLGESPGYLSGLSLALQSVSIEVTELRSGQGLQVGDHVDLGVPLVAGAPDVSLTGDAPTLSPSLYHADAPFMAHVKQLGDRWIALKVDIEATPPRNLAGRGPAAGRRRRLGGGTLSDVNNEPPRQGRHRKPASNINSAGPTTYTSEYVPNNEITFEFAAFGVEDDDPTPFQGPVDGEITVVLKRLDDTPLGQFTVRLKDDRRSYITFTGSSSDPMDAAINYTATVYNRINPNQTLGLRMWVWT